MQEPTKELPPALMSNAVQLEAVPSAISMVCEGITQTKYTECGGYLIGKIVERNAHKFKKL